MIYAIIVGMWFVLIGLYSFYFAFSMKKTGTIKAGWMVSRNIQLTECKNIPGYIDYAYPKTMIFGSIVVIMGILLMIGAAVSFHAISAISILVLVVTYFVYSSMMSRAQKEYLTKSLKKRTRNF